MQNAKAERQGKASWEKVHEIEQEGNIEMCIGTIEEKQSEEQSAVQIDTVTAATWVESEKWIETLRVNNRALTFKLDPRAKCNVLSYKDFKSVAGENQVNA